VLGVLRENRELNHCRFEILPGAAGAESDSIAFFIGGDTLCSSTLTETSRAVTVPTVTLARIAGTRGFDRCAVVCDIEGAETQLIRQEMETLRSRVEVFIVEFHPRINGLAEVDAAQQSLIANGFELLWTEAGVCVYLNRAFS
jgi:FkbM family methyltransferase